jgi:hypothetical protein
VSGGVGPRRRRWPAVTSLVWLATACSSGSQAPPPPDGSAPADAPSMRADAPAPARLGVEDPGGRPARGHVGGCLHHLDGVLVQQALPGQLGAGQRPPDLRARPRPGHQA